MMMFMLMTFLSIMTTMINHPLSMTIIILIQTIMISLVTGSLSLNFWYSYILLLIMIGGMLILFIYMTSIASNEKFKLSKNSIYLFMALLSMNLIYFMDPMIMSYKLNNFMLMPFKSFMFNLSLNKFLNFPMMNIYIIMIIYLFITLIAIVKITNFKNGPLRQKF